MSKNICLYLNQDCKHFECVTTNDIKNLNSQIFEGDFKAYSQKIAISDILENNNSQNIESQNQQQNYQSQEIQAPYINQQIPIYPLQYNNHIQLVALVRELNHRVTQLEAANFRQQLEISRQHEKISVLENVIRQMNRKNYRYQNNNY